MNIPLYKIFTDQEEIDRVLEVIKRASWWTEGKETKQFEEMVAEYVGTKYAATFNSGTSALHALMLAFKIGIGDEVIVPSFSFIATANAPLFVGAKPVFADIETDTYGLDIESVVEKITKKTKAIMPVHYGGTACRDIIKLKKLAEDNNILLFEDSAESQGAKINGTSVGSIGDGSIFSLCGPKVMTTGEGGIVTTNSKKAYDRLKLVRSHGRELKQYFGSSNTLDYLMLGYNWRVPTMVSALGIAQMHKIDKMIHMRLHNSIILLDLLRNVKEITKLPELISGYRQVYQLFTIEVDETIRDDLIKFLTEKGIATKVYFSPIHLTKFHRGFGHKVGELPITENKSKQVITLPMYPSLTLEEMNYIKEAINDFF